MDYYRPTPSGAIVVESCCPATEVPTNVCSDISENFDPYQNNWSYTNTTSSPIQLVVEYGVGPKPSKESVVLFPGEASIVFEDVQGYTITCLTQINLTCSSSGAFSVPANVLFNNTSATEGIVLQVGTGIPPIVATGYYAILPSTYLVLLSTNSYSVTGCAIPETIELQCDDSRNDIPTPNIITFSNPGAQQLTVSYFYANTMFPASNIIPPGESLSPLPNVTSYSTTCP
jgi:hypothetical protein